MALAVVLATAKVSRILVVVLTAAAAVVVPALEAAPRRQTQVQHQALAAVAKAILVVADKILRILHRHQNLALLTLTLALAAILAAALAVPVVAMTVLAPLEGGIRRRIMGRRLPRLAAGYTYRSTNSCIIKVFYAL